MLSFISTSARSSSSSLTVAGCSLGCELGLRPLGSLAFTTEPVELYRGSLIKKSLKTKPKKRRPTTCKRNLLGIFKSSSCRQQSRHHSHLSCAIPLAGWRDHWSLAGVGQVLLITKELLLERHSWASSSGPSAHSCVGRSRLYSWPNCPRAVPWRLMHVTLNTQSWGGGGWAFPREQC